MDMLDLFITIVIGILTLITIIVFFGMASNIRKILEVVRKDDIDVYSSEYLDKINEEIYIGNKVRAIELLRRGKYRCDKIKSQQVKNNMNTNIIDSKITEIEELLKQLENHVGAEKQV